MEWLIPLSGQSGGRERAGSLERAEQSYGDKRADATTYFLEDCDCRYVDDLFIALWYRCFGASREVVAYRLRRHRHRVQHLQPAEDPHE